MIFFTNLDLSHVVNHQHGLPVLLWNLGKPSKIRPTVSSRQNIPAV